MAVFNVSTQDLKKKVLAKCGEVVDGTSTYDVDGTVLGFLNNAYLKVLEGGNEFVPELSKPWPWAIAKDPITFVLQPPYITGTLSTVNGSTTITFSNPPATSAVGWWLKVDGRPEWFKILAHTGAAATATIDTPYTDSTSSGLTFKLILLDYDLVSTNGILRIVSPMVVYRPQGYTGDEEAKIYLSEEASMLRDFPLTRIQQGTPDRFAIMRKASGAITIRVNRYVEFQSKVECRRIDIPDALTDSLSNYPLIPPSFRDILTYIAAYWLCVDKNDDRSDKYLQLAQAQGRAMIGATEKEKIQTAKNRGQLTPRLDKIGRMTRFFPQETS